MEEKEKEIQVEKRVNFLRKRKKGKTKFVARKREGKPYYV
jgi:hypothetical protein